MSGTLTLSTETVLNWFGALGARLPRVYATRTTYTRNGGWHLATIYFGRVRLSRYHLALYQVQSSAHYVVALCEMDGIDRVCHRAWSLVDEQPPINPPKIFCSSCVYVHEEDNDGCEPQKAEQLAIFANGGDERTELPISQLVESITSDLDRLVPAL